MKKNFLLVATVAVAMVGCTNDTDLSGGKSIAQQTTDGSIAFNMNTPATTRTGTSTDAGKLNNMFIVWGEKNENQSSSKKADAKDIVFKNYVVKHDKTGGSDATNNYGANSTTSNTNGWEYVGIDHSDFDTNVKTTIGSGVAQTIKYWDDQATSYTFTAVSALQSDIKEGKVIIEKIVGTDQEDTSKKVYDKGYTIQVKEGANTDNIYYADRNNIQKGNGYDHSVVTLTFRNFKSKIRFGIFETVPGYKVVITGIKYNGTAHTTTTDKFGIDGEFVIPGNDTNGATGGNDTKSTKYTVTYEDNNSANPNKVKATIDNNNKNTQAYFEQGTTWLSTSASSPVGTAANNPTWNDTDGAYKTILPNPQNQQNLKLQVAYKLVSVDTNEEIEFKTGEGTNATEIYRTVEIPYEYCQWKPNYAYTYLFKITDKSAALNPITFDACVVESETGKQETITTVGAPYITTIAQRTNNGSSFIVYGSNEYVAGDTIYATVYEGSSIATLTKNSNIDLYKVTTSDETNFPITEASVAHALEVTTESGVTKKITATAETLNDNNIVTSVPTEDGSTVTLSNSGKALKWTAAANTVYAVVYTKTDANDTSKKTYTCKIVRIGNTHATQATGENMVWKNLQ